MNLANPIIAALSVVMLSVMSLSACAQSPSEDRQSLEPDSLFIELRQQVLSITPGSLGLSESSQSIPGMLMEIRFEGGIATLVTLGDGTTSLYMSSGGGWIGMGGIESVRTVSSNLLALAGSFVDGMQAVDVVPLPGEGRVRFTVFTPEGLKSEEVGEEALQTKRDTLWPLYRRGHEVIAAIRQTQEQREE